MIEVEKLPARVRAVIEACKSGETLCKTIRHKETGETELIFHFHPSQRHAPQVSSQQAIDSGLLVPGNDGLFEADNSQTWRAA